MYRRFMSLLLLSTGIWMSGNEAAHGYGYLPPVPPPENFKVEVRVSYVKVTLNAHPTAKSLLLQVDGQALETLDGSVQTATVFIFLDPYADHQFSLVAVDGMGRKSAPAYYVYQAPTPIWTDTATYQFRNASSTGPVVTGYITINPYSGGGQPIVSSPVGPNATFTGEVSMPTDIFYVVAAKGFVTVGSGISCNQVHYNGSLNGKKITATYYSAENASAFRCELKVE